MRRTDGDVGSPRGGASGTVAASGAGGHIAADPRCRSVPDPGRAPRRAGVAPHDLGVRQLRLLTNNPRKVVGLDGYGLRIVDRVPLQIESNDDNRRYLQTKRDKMGHLLDAEDV